MKTTLAILAVIFSLFLASCSSTYDASAPYDEVYSTSDKQSKNVVAQDVTVVGENVTVMSEPVESTTAYEGDYYSPEYAEGEFDSEGYYDYEYSSRIKRFHGDNPGFDYYDNYYTDNYYYNYDPYAMGSNIYNGYGCCGSGLSLNFGMGYGWGGNYGWGYPYYSPYYSYSPFWGYYDPWYYPYYGGWGYGYPGSYWGNSYWSGYNHGYWDGYWNGQYWGGGYYPDPEPDPYGHYYGPRGSRSGSTDGGSGNGNLTRGDRTGDDNNVPSFEQGARGIRTEGTTTSAVGGATATKEKDPGTGITGSVRDEGSNRAVIPKTDEPATGGTATKTSVTAGKAEYNKPPEALRNEPTSGTNVKTEEKTTLSPSRKVQPDMKYEKPQTYTSPSARTTPSKQEYISPGTRDSRTFSGQEGNTTRKVYSTTPERKTSSGSNTSTRESGTSNKYNSVAPSQKYSTPDKPSSKNTYTAPSSSGSRSYSAPSKSYSAPSSSGSGGSSRSSGSSSGSSSSGSSSSGSSSSGSSSSGSSSSGSRGGRK